MPVYYFFGGEDYRKIEAVKYILNRYIPQQQRLLNFTRLSVEKGDFEAIFSELAAIPMLGEKRLIFIDEIQKLKPTQQKKLFSFISTPPPDTIIILSSPAAHTPKRKSAFYRDVSKVSTPIQFDRLTGNSARSKIIRHLTSADFTFDDEAINLLLSLTDGNFGGLVGELEKLSLSTDKGNHIGVDEVKKLVSSHAEFNIFELIDLVAENNLDRALMAYSDLIQKGMKPVPILRLLSGHMMNLLKIHTGKKVANHPFFVEKLRRQASVYDQDRVLKAIALIARAERDIRRARIEPIILTENMIREISR
jgi:DNA polymerase-3 subunit delta